MDALVNDAGTAEGSRIWETSLERCCRVTEVDQTGVFLGMRASVDPMTRAGGGSMINLSSIDGMVGSPGIVSYIASRWAVRGMTRAVAMALAPRGIRVNSSHVEGAPGELAPPRRAALRSGLARITDVMRDAGEAVARPS